MKLLDDAICLEYERFAVPADRIVIDPHLAAEFADRVKASLSMDAELDVAAVNHRLIALRKRGEAKGGLPRLERDYRERKPRPR